MRKTADEDLRVRKTRLAIHNAFRQLLAAMPYEMITVKELSEMAQINRKTFYLHYPAMDDLLYELQDEIALDFAGITAQYDRIEDMPEITRAFFTHSEGLDAVHQRILASRGSDGNDANRPMNQIMELNRRCIDSMGEMTESMHNLIRAFLTASSVAIYQQWISDGRKIPLDDMIDITSQLICKGVLNLETGQITKN